MIPLGVFDDEIAADAFDEIVGMSSAVGVSKLLGTVWTLERGAVLVDREPGDEASRSILEDVIEVLRMICNARERSLRDRTEKGSCPSGNGRSDAPSIVVYLPKMFDDKYEECKFQKLVLSLSSTLKVRFH
ncbi:hypothetical protein QAD02_001466 [Eretmocerus hayati]|uniref:Uncharacterized protein n=1 Tax=Eretmocerus hayati TaxID=131215 RepID=A0ACC2NGI5_9HYME|nr:hypothetical protein QAD02_001466 [Eretmocerus hayati]